MANKNTKSKISDMLIGFPRGNINTSKILFGREPSIPKNKKNISQAQFLSSPALIRKHGFWADSDKDGRHLNFGDCMPFDKKRHGTLPSVFTGTPNVFTPYVPTTGGSSSAITVASGTPSYTQPSYTQKSTATYGGGSGGGTFNIPSSPGGTTTTPTTTSQPGYQTVKVGMNKYIYVNGKLTGVDTGTQTRMPTASEKFSYGSQTQTQKTYQTSYGPRSTAGTGGGTFNIPSAPGQSASQIASQQLQQTLGSNLTPWQKQNIQQAQQQSPKGTFYTKPVLVESAYKPKTTWQEIKEQGLMKTAQEKTGEAFARHFNVVQGQYVELGRALPQTAYLVPGVGSALLVESGSEAYWTTQGKAKRKATQEYIQEKTGSKAVGILGSHAIPVATIGLGLYGLKTELRNIGVRAEVQRVAEAPTLYRSGRVQSEVGGTDFILGVKKTGKGEYFGAVVQPFFPMKSGKVVAEGGRGFAIGKYGKEPISISSFETFGFTTPVKTPASLIRKQAGVTVRTELGGQVAVGRQAVKETARGKVTSYLDLGKSEINLIADLKPVTTPETIWNPVFSVSGKKGEIITSVGGKFTKARISPITGKATYLGKPSVLGKTKTYNMADLMGGFKSETGGGLKIIEKPSYGGGIPSRPGIQATKPAVQQVVKTQPSPVFAGENINVMISKVLPQETSNVAGLFTSSMALAQRTLQREVPLLSPSQVSFVQKGTEQVRVPATQAPSSAISSFLNILTGQTTTPTQTTQPLQTQIPKTAQQPRQSPTSPTASPFYPGERVPRKEIVPVIPLPTLKGPMVKSKPYNAYAYVDATKGQKAGFVQLNEKPLTLKSALSAMARVVDNTISARGKVSAAPTVKQKGKEVTQKAMDTKDNYFQVNTNKFRTYSGKKMKPLSTGTVIERQKYRLDRAGETRNIQSAKRTPFGF